MTSAAANISVLIAEDSPTQREVLIFMLEEAGGFRVVGTARDGVEVVSAAERLHPDIILMDCHMPNANGFEATQAIMHKCPTPIVMVSSTLAPDEVEHTFDAIKNGALAFLAKPSLDDTPEESKSREALFQTLRLMSEVKVVGRRGMARKKFPTSARLPAVDRTTKLIAIAGSTGAPGVIAEILSAAAERSMAPILIVQHMAAGFVAGFARWLSGSVGFPVKVAEQGMLPAPGEAYLAPDNLHMGLDSLGRIVLSGDAPEEGFRPSANFLFRSVAKSAGPSALGVLLTGMGRDGATGLLALRQAGAMTIAQNEASCVVFGMPREAIAVGAAKYVLSPTEVARVLASTANNFGGERSVKR